MRWPLAVKNVSARENSEVDGEEHRKQHEDHKRQIEDIGNIELELLFYCLIYDAGDDQNCQSNAESRNDLCMILGRSKSLETGNMEFPAELENYLFHRQQHQECHCDKKCDLLFRICLLQRTGAYCLTHQQYLFRTKNS